MAQTATNPKIEELRSRLKSDPKSRLFFPLAEELRKAGNCTEAEQVLRAGLTTYPTYLGAWVSLGRVLRDQKNDTAAVDALNTALQLDPGNVVAARLLGDAYLALGEKVEAIKKYKLVHALMPSDDEVRGTIEQLDRDLHPPSISVASESETFETSAEHDAAAWTDSSASVTSFDEAPSVAEPSQSWPAPEEPAFAMAPEAAAPEEEESPFDKTAPPFADAMSSYDDDARLARETADVEPMGYAHDESPFEEPAAGYSADALEVEAPSGFQIDDAPMAAEVPSTLGEELSAIDSTPVFDSPVSPAVPDAAETATMADLYVKQGLLDEARQIYQNVLARDPGNEEVRAKLEAIAPPGPNPKVARLENWLTRMTRKEADGV
jgi:tetratricopeptide (TPR) repeat protein